MDKKFKAELEINYFECDIITTSADHDNGYIDIEDLERSLKNIAQKVKGIFD